MGFRVIVDSVNSGDNSIQYTSLSDESKQLVRRKIASAINICVATFDAQHPDNNIAPLANGFKLSLKTNVADVRKCIAQEARRRSLVIKII